jgi:hypothetical protein
LCKAKGQHLKDVVAEHWPSERELVLRAASAPATMTGVNWADTIVGATVSDFLGLLGPASASAALFASGIQFQFDGTGVIILPTLKAAAANADFVGEGAPIPVIQFDTSAKLILKPYKFAAISVFTRETFEHSTPNIESIVRATLLQSVALALDAKSLDAVAASAIRPAGLRNGISAVGTASNDPDPLERMKIDVAAVCAPVIAIAGTAPIIIVAAPPQALALKMWTWQSSFPQFDILASSGLANGTIMAIASNALVSATDAAPRFEVVSDATAHFDGTVPLDITTAAVAGTVKSLYQSDLIGLRTVFELSWGLRDPGGLAWLSSVGW